MHETRLELTVTFCGVAERKKETHVTVTKTIFPKWSTYVIISHSNGKPEPVPLRHRYFSIYRY
jgi:hypothetical protein